MHPFENSFWCAFGSLFLPAIAKLINYPLSTTRIKTTGGHQKNCRIEESSQNKEADRNVAGNRLQIHCPYKKSCCSMACGQMKLLDQWLF